MVNGKGEVVVSIGRLLVFEQEQRGLCQRKCSCRDKRMGFFQRMCSCRDKENWLSFKVKPKIMNMEADGRKRKSGYREDSVM